MRTTTSARRIGAATLVVAFALTACGSDATDEASDDTTDTASEGDASDDASEGDTRTLTDQFGEVTISGTPERIVAPGSFETDILLGLGITPLAIGSWDGAPGGIPPWREQFDGVHDIPQIVYNPDGYDVEETLAFEPDLVLAGHYILPEEYDALSAAVPTLAPAYETPIEDQIRLIGEAVNRPGEAEQLIEQQRALLEETRETYPQLVGATIAVAWAGEAGLLTDFTDSGTLGFAELLGLEPAPGMEPIEDFAQVGAEDWGAFDGDVFLVSFADEQLQAEFEADPLFQRIPGVAEERYIGEPDFIEFENLRATSPAQIEHSVEVFVPRLAALLDG